MTDKTTITDQHGDELTISTGQPSARGDQVTVHVKEAHRGRVHAAAVHVTPAELRDALARVAPLGAYERHESPDYCDGGVTAAAIEEEAGVDAAGSRLAAFARKMGAPPKWTNAPAVQAWHRSDHRTERDGTPGQPRIWSPDYKTTETWSTPSLRNVHWSDLVDVTPLGPVRECPNPEQHEKREPRPLTPGDITDEMVERAVAEADAWPSAYVNATVLRAALTAALTVPTRPEWADVADTLHRLWPDGLDGIASEDVARRLHTEGGVRVEGRS